VRVEVAFGDFGPRCDLERARTSVALLHERLKRRTGDASAARILGSGSGIGRCRFFHPTQKNLLRWYHFVPYIGVRSGTEVWTVLATNVQTFSARRRKPR